MERTGWHRRVMGCVAALLMVLMVAGCSGETGMPSVGAPDSGEAYPQEDGGAALPQEGGDDEGEDRLVIRTKTMRLEVAATPAAVDGIRDLTRTHSGTVSDMQVATDSEEWVYRHTESGDGTALRGWITVRVPSDEYEDFIAATAALGTVKYQSEATSDVTQEHVDLSARLENLRAQEVRLREFFDAATDVDDMLAIEKELGRVRGDIESLDAQVTYLERQAAMATVTIELTEPRAVVRPNGESWGFVDAITTGVRGAAELVTGLLAFLIATSPLWIVAGVAYVVIRRVVRRRRAAAPPAWRDSAAPPHSGDRGPGPQRPEGPRPAPPPTTTSG